MVSFLDASDGFSPELSLEFPQGFLLEFLQVFVLKFLLETYQRFFLRIFKNFLLKIVSCGNPPGVLFRDSPRTPSGKLQVPAVNSP